MQKLDSSDLHVLRQAILWLQQQRPTVLITVIRTWGSAPRSAGALMAVCHDGEYLGSVSGGCVEEDLLTRVQDGEFHAGIPTVLHYGVTQEHARRFGLPCGGQLELLIEYLTHADSLTPVLDKMQQRQPVIRRVCLSTGEISLHAATAGEDLRVDAINVSKVFGPRWRLLLVGANDVAYYVAQLARTLDYDIIVCDPRPERQAYWQSTDATFTRAMPDDAVKEIADDACTAVLSLAHDPKLDDLALLEGLISKAFYVGALGSQKTNLARRERLRALGVSENNLLRLRGPIGLDIGSKTPAEIAIAILADLIATRHGKRTGTQLLDSMPTP